MSSRNFLITGAARGIGRGLSRSLLQSGHRVFLIDNNADELSHTLSTFQSSSSGIRQSTYASSLCNLRNPSEITSAVQQASTFFNGHLDVLVNNAAFTSDGPFWSQGQTMETVALEEWNAFLETNLTGPFLVSQACLPMLKKGKDRAEGGSIIHMSSTRANMSEPNSEGYATTKAGLVGLTHSMAVSLAPMGVTVNTILPGWIHVDNERKEADLKGTPWEEGLRVEDHQWHLSGRVGKVEDIVKAVEYLATARFATGTEMVVDGGVTRKMVYPEE